MSGRESASRTRWRASVSGDLAKLGERRAAIKAHIAKRSELELF